MMMSPDACLHVCSWRYVCMGSAAARELRILCGFSQLSCASTVSRNWLASRFPVHGTRLARRRFIGIFQCLLHASANSSLCVPVPCIIVYAHFVAAPLHLHGRSCYVMRACASKLVSIPRRTTHEHRTIKTSNLGQLAATLERLITN